ncbi:MAG TPA: hypothetical protein VHU91_08525 [Mycobacteriales bacterium]|jgi:hypothetical protein|nr:hypothetical protein [Mycobacteriales bacterium]
MDEAPALGIYLNDHVAGAYGGVELARRIAQTHHACADGQVFQRLAADIAADRGELLDIMSRLGIKRRRYKSYGAWLVEKLGRLKLNGSLLRRSPLSTLVEFEALVLGVHGKAALWRTLRLVAEVDDRLDQVQLHRLAQRAGEQTQLLERWRMRAAETVFGVSAEQVGVAKEN